MKYLFDSTGRHIANLVNGQLHAPTGENIGHLLSDHGIFIDMSGRYLGEIVYNDRLMYKRSSPYLSANFGAYGNYGNAGNYGTPGNHGNIGIVSEYSDLVPNSLR